MKRQIKHIARIGLLALTALLLVTSMPSCKGSKCDCPTFGGQRQRH